MSRERPLPTADSVRKRRETVREEVLEVTLEVRLCKWWRWRHKARLREQLEYLEGMSEGLRLAGGV